MQKKKTADEGRSEHANRYKKIKEVRERIANDEREELDRIKQKFRDNPAQVVSQRDAEILLRAVGAVERDSAAGRPALVDGFHRWVAIDYLWRTHLLRPLRQKQVVALLEMSETWGLSEGAVKKAAREHKGDALQFVDSAIKQREIASHPEQHDRAVESNIEMHAEMFRKLGE